MGCFDGNCSGKICKPDLISPHFPPKKVGWRLIGWPDFVPIHFRETYGGNPVMWGGNTSHEVIAGIAQVLNANNITIDKESLCDWANEQWCAADPDRCKSTQSAASKINFKRTAGLVSDVMLWATPFWRMANIAVSSNQPDSYARGAIEMVVDMADMLIVGDFGCPKCATHFKELQEAYPVGKISTWKQARIWLWRVHNESREKGIPVAYSEIANIYGWESLDNTEVLRVVNEELRA